MKDTRLFSILLVGSLLVACGDDSSKSTPVIDIEDEADAGNTSNADGGESDATVDMSDVPEGCAADGFEIDSALARKTNTSLSFVGRTAGDRYDELFFYQVTDSPAPGVLAFDTSSYAECTACLTIQTGCTDAGCEATYMARSGSIELTQVDEVFQASLADLRLEPVTIAEDGTTTVLDGDAFCLTDTVELSSAIEVDECAGWADPQLVDTNCGDAPLTVNWNWSGFIGQLDSFESVSIDFGDGESYFSTTEGTTSHTYAAGDWDVELEAVGYIDGTRVTLTTPERIRAN